MNWKDIKTTQDNTSFLYNENILFSRKFIEVLKFHAPGLAPVLDESGAYHITTEGEPLYPYRYKRTFGFYDNRATVIGFILMKKEKEYTQKIFYGLAIIKKTVVQ